MPEEVPCTPLLHVITRVDDRWPDQQFGSFAFVLRIDKYAEIRDRQDRLRWLLARLLKSNGCRLNQRSHQLCTDERIGSPREVCVTSPTPQPWSLSPNSVLNQAASSAGVISRGVRHESGTNGAFPFFVLCSRAYIIRSVQEVCFPCPIPCWI